METKGKKQSGRGAAKAVRKPAKGKKGLSYMPGLGYKELVPDPFGTAIDANVEGNFKWM